jgi:hypothetical protein
MRIVLFLLLAGCAAQHAVREAADLAGQGHPYAAAERYLDALDRRPSFAMAQEGLVSVAEGAYQERLNEARAAEARGDWDHAVAVYGELAALLDRLRARNAIDFPTVDVAARVANTENRAADEEYAKALAAESAGTWDAAVLAWRAAATYVPGFRDTDLRTRNALFHWAEAQEKAGAWRAAADHFAEAGAGTWGDGNRRAASILAALGNASVWAGTCRQAVRDLRAAGALIGVEAIAGDLADAERCAVTTAVILPFENPSGASPGGLVLSEAAAEGLSVALAKSASPFVHLLERGVTEQIKAEQAITTAKTGAPSSLTRAHYLVVGKFSQVKVASGAPTATPVTILGKAPNMCKRTGADGVTFTEPCMQDAEVRYLDHVGKREVRLAGTVRVVMSQSGEQVAVVPFDVRRSAEVHWADGFTNASGKPVRLVEEGTVDGPDVRVPASVLALKNAGRTLPEEDDMVRDAMAEVANAAAKAALAVLDADPAVTDPKTLEIVEL